MTISDLFQIAAVLIFVGIYIGTVKDLKEDNKITKQDLKVYGQDIAALKSDVENVQNTTDRIDRNIEHLMKQKQ